MKTKSSCVILRHDGKFAAIRSYKHGGLLCLPGGKAEPNESPEETARRETQEEVGVSLLRLDKLFVSDVGGYDCSTFVSAICADAPLVSGEEGEACWVTGEELLANGKYPEHTREWLAMLPRFDYALRIAEASVQIVNAPSEEGVARNFSVRIVSPIDREDFAAFADDKLPYEFAYAVASGIEGILLQVALKAQKT